VKVLLDENLDHRLRKNLGGHEVFTVRYKGWAGLKNGELLRTAEADGIEVFLTGDQNVLYQQNLAERSLAVVALSSVEWHILKNDLPAIVTAIEQAAPGSFQAVKCGTFNRKQQQEIRSSRSRTAIQPVRACGRHSRAGSPEVPRASKSRQRILKEKLRVRE